MNTLLNRLFPLRHIQDVAMFYVLSAVYNVWIIAGVWVFIWGAFMTKTQIGISDSITFTVGFLVELPSGVFADLIGRKKAIVLGNIMLVVGNLFVGISSSFLSLTGWFLVWTIGYAFQSGATEAHVYDSVKNQGLEDEWQSVISTSTVIAKATTLICTAAGGYLFLLGFRLPYLVTTALSAIGIFAALRLSDIPVVKTTHMWSMSTYFKQIKDGVSTLVRPSIFPVALISLAVAGIGYMYSWGLLRPLTAERFGYSATTYSLLLALTSFIAIVSIILLRKISKKIKPEILIFIIGLVYAVLFFILGFPHALVIGGGIMIVLAVALTYMDILFSQYINQHTKAEHRATTLSAVALFTRMPYVFLALLIGKMADNNQLPLYTMITGGVALALWLISFTSFARKKAL